MTPRRPLTGHLTVEWVDGADPDDASQPANFGWFKFNTEPRLDNLRLLELLRALTVDVEERIADGLAD